MKIRTESYVTASFEIPLEIPKTGDARISISTYAPKPSIQITASGSTPEEAREAFEKAKAAIMEALQC